MTLWGGRFGEQPSADAWAFTVSTADRRLLSVDVRGSVAHVEGLVAAAILTRDEGDTLLGGLATIAEEASHGAFVWQDDDEDVHSAVERRLGELVGDVAGKLHTGRSRNDQIALDVRLFLRDASTASVAGIDRLIDSLIAAAERVGDTVVASYTHLQPAQAVPLAHHLLAHAWALARDAERFGSLVGRLDVSPLGAGAGGGTRLPLDPAFTAERLGMSGHFDNSMDAVASRDLVAEYAFCAAQTLVHLSRLGEELVLWGTEEFAWAEYSDAHTTGSSALPHKKNPDVAELARGKAATGIGVVTGLLTMQKGLPLTYNRDLQEDKEHLFATVDGLLGGLAAIAGMVEGAVFDPPAPSPWIGALDLAEVLVERGVPFREAHEAVGRLVSSLLDADRDLAAVTSDDLTAAHPSFDVGDAALVDPVASVRARRSPGGGSFESVRVQIDVLRAR